MHRNDRWMRVMDSARRNLGLWLALLVVVTVPAWGQTGDSFGAEVKSTGRVEAAEQAAFERCLALFSRRSVRDDFTATDAFLRDYPGGGWSVGLRLQLAEEYYATGWYSRALKTLEELWEERRRGHAPEAAVLLNRAALRWAEMSARLGRRETVERVISELDEKAVHPDDLETLRAVQQGWGTMNAQPHLAFRCGALALERIRVFLNPTHAGHEAVLNARSTVEGMSLLEVASLAKATGMEYQMAFREKGATWLTPMLMHLQVGHFVAVLRERGSTLQVEDPTGWQTVFASRRALDAEGSGYCLVPSGPLPKGWRSVSHDEASRVWGRNGLLDNDPDGTGKRDRRARCGGGSSRGMATWDIHLMMVSQQIVDTPIGYRPPFGPAVDITWRRTQRSNRRFGYKPTWTHNWSGQIYENPLTPTGDVWLQEEGGWERYSPLDDEGLTYQSRLFNQGRLRRVQATNLVWELPDGTRQWYTARAGTNVAWGRVFHLSAMEDESGNRVTIQTSANGRVESLTDPLGRVTRFFYELPNPGVPPERGGVVGGPSTSGVLQNFEYTNQITRIVDPFGRTARFDYTRVERSVTGFCGGGVGACPFFFYQYDLTRITDVAGLTSEFVYDPTGTWVRELITPYGTTRFQWSSGGPGDYALEVTDPGGETERVEYRSLTSADTGWVRPQGVRTSGGGVAVAHWSKNAYAEQYRPNDSRLTGATVYLFQLSDTLLSAGRILKAEKPPLENPIWYNYPQQGSPSLPGLGDLPSREGRVLDDGTSQVWITERDAWGNVVRAVDPVGRTTRSVYDANGIDLLEVRQELTAGTEALLMRATWTPQHRMQSFTDGAGSTTWFGYNARGQLVAVTNALNEVTRYEHDGDGFLVAIDGPLPGTVDREVMTYDDVGRVKTVGDSAGRIATFEYDALDRLTRLTEADGTFWELTYDRLEVATVRDRLGNTRRYRWDSNRRLAAVEDALGHITRYQWCGCDGLSAITDSQGRMTQWHRDVQGRLIAKEFPDGSRIQYEYEQATSRLRRRRDARNQVTEFQYAVDNTLVRQRYPDATVPTPELAWTYDPAFRRVTGMTDGNGLTEYRYHPFDGRPGAGRIAEVDGPWAKDEVTFAYDRVGRVADRTIGGASMGTSYDAAGRVMRVTNALGTFQFTWDGSSDRLESVAYPNGQRAEYRYYGDSADRQLRSMAYTLPGGGSLARFEYAYDPEGRIVRWTQEQAGRVREWQPRHDADHRLTNLVETVDGGPSRSFEWVYDESGNLTASVAAGVRREFAHNALNQVAVQNRPVSEPAAVYEWDAEDRLVRIRRGTREVEFSHDGLGRRTRRIERENGQVVADRSYLWVGLELCEERDGSGATVRKRYFPQGFENLADPAWGIGPHFYAKDHLGSVRAVVGAGVSSFEYTPFGERSRIAGQGEPDVGFTGHWHLGAEGLVMAPRRAYAPDRGSWLSRDPAGEEAGLNLYSYAFNNPLHLLDPDGGAPTSAGPASHPAFGDIIKVVANDPQAVKFIDDPAFRNKGNQAGNSRNMSFRTKPKHWFKDWDRPASMGGLQDYVCDGIANRADTLILQGIWNGKAPLKGKVKKTQVIHRRKPGTFMESDHEAVLVTMDSGEEYVFDWHATLDVNNPEISTKADFCSGGTCGAPGSSLFP